MKFGNNLASLSIPEWKNYNIDYNGLKEQIKHVTRSKETNLTQLRKQFFENFKYVNILIRLKHDELNRRLDYLQSFIDHVNASSDFSIAEKQARYDEILYHSLDIVATLKNLTKFILIQKIACQKIFKKFIKYYHDKDVANRFVNRIKASLEKKENSFVDFDLSGLTLKSTNMINLLKHKQKALREGETSSVVRTHPPLKKHASSVAMGSHLVEDNFKTHNAHIQQIPSTESANFDLLTLLKKNFSLDFLVLDEINNVNDIILNLNFYANLENIDESGPKLMTFIYLQNDNLVGEPSYIMTEENSDFSTIIAYVGGLRKYSYCVLPNYYTQALIDYMVEKDESKAAIVKDTLKSYFIENKVTYLTKLTIDTILSKQKVPKLKIAFERSRFLMNKEEEEEEEEVHSNFTLNSGASFKREYEDDYLATLDTGLCTTNDEKLVQTLRFDNLGSYDRFPFNHLTIYSNDSNLSTFSDGLETKIEGSNLVNSYSRTSMRKLPRKIQHLVQDERSLNMFKNMNFYHYMSTCYLNMIPPDCYINNHYSHLLNLNLFKSFENVKECSFRQSIDESLMNNRLAQLHFSKLRSSKGSVISNESSNRLSLLNVHSSETENEAADENYADDHWQVDDSQWSGIVRLEKSQSSISVWNNFLLKFVRLKDKAMEPFHEMTPLVADLEYHYDSLSDDATSLDRFNAQSEMQYRVDYDAAISYAYFSLLAFSLLISGVELGILNSIEMADNTGSKFFAHENIWLIVLLIVGIAFSLFFGIISVNLSLSRLNNAPMFHSFLIWIGFSVVCSCSVWSCLILFQN